MPVSVTLNDKEIDRKNVTVSANSSALAEFTGFDLPLGFSKGRVHVEADDALKLDNDFLFAIERREKMNVLVVDAGKPKQSLYLRQAYTSTPDLPFEVTVMISSAVTPEEIAKASGSKNRTRCPRSCSARSATDENVPSSATPEPSVKESPMKSTVRSEGGCAAFPRNPSIS